jgi:enamine deaminase RidA (YjgF/YER057c/UK114 family)
VDAALTRPSAGWQDVPVDSRQLVSSGGPWEGVVGYSRAVRAGPWVCVSGTTAALEGGGAVGGDDVGAQAREALRRIAVALEQAGAGLEHVVRTRIYVTDIDRWEEVGRVHGEVFADVRPAATMVEVHRLIDPALLVEIEADAVVPGPVSAQGSGDGSRNPLS